MKHGSLWITSVDSQLGCKTLVCRRHPGFALHCGWHAGLGRHCRPARTTKQSVCGFPATMAPGGGSGRIHSVPGERVTPPRGSGPSTAGDSHPGPPQRPSRPSARMPHRVAAPWSTTAPPDYRVTEHSADRAHPRGSALSASTTSGPTPRASASPALAPFGVTASTGTARKILASLAVGAGSRVPPEAGSPDAPPSEPVGAGVPSATVDAFPRTPRARANESVIVPLWPGVLSAQHHRPRPTRRQRAAPSPGSATGRGTGSATTVAVGPRDGVRRSGPRWEYPGQRVGPTRPPASPRYR